MFDVGQCNTSCLGFSVKQPAINCFWKIRAVLSRTYKFYSSAPEKNLLASAVSLLLLGLG